MGVRLASHVETHHLLNNIEYTMIFINLKLLVKYGKFINFLIFQRLFFLDLPSIEFGLELLYGRVGVF